MGTLECMAAIAITAIAVRILLRIIGKAVSVIIGFVLLSLVAIAVFGVFSVAASALHAIF